MLGFTGDFGDYSNFKDSFFYKVSKISVTLCSKYDCLAFFNELKIASGIESRPFLPMKTVFCLT